MKVQIAVIKLVLRTNKVLSDGSHPIMLRVSFNGMKEKSTGYSCPLNQWDKKNECIKKGYPNYTQINLQLRKFKNEAIEKRDRFIALGEDYTPQMILSKGEEKKVVRNDVWGLIEAYIHDRAIEGGTKYQWIAMYGHLLKFVGKKSILINEIDSGLVRRFAKYLEGFLSSATIRKYLTKLKALCTYCEGKGIINEEPFKDWKFWKEYKDGKNELYINGKTMDLMIELFIDSIIIRKSNDNWTYRDGVIEELLDIKSDLYARYLFIIGYYLCGLAPLDVSLLEKSSIKSVSIADSFYYAIDGLRTKTKQPFKIRLPQNTLLSNVLIRTMLMFNEGKYFLPTMNGFRGDNYKARVSSVYTHNTEKLLDWFREINEIIAKRNYEGNSYEFIDLNCRYYAYRHSYIMAEIQKPNVNLLKLATQTGKSVATLHQYLALLNDVNLV